MAETRSKTRSKKRSGGKDKDGLTPQKRLEAENKARWDALTPAQQENERSRNLKIVGGLAVGAGAANVLSEVPGFIRRGKANAAATAANQRGAAQAVRQAGTGRVTSGVIPMGNTRPSGGIRFPPSTYTPTPTGPQALFRAPSVPPETPVTLGNRIPETPVTLGNRIPETPVSLSNRAANPFKMDMSALKPASVPAGPSSAYPPVSGGPPLPPPGTFPGTPPAGTAPPANFGMNLNNPAMRNSSAGGEVFNIAEGQAAAKGAQATGLRGVGQAIKGGGLGPALRNIGAAPGAGGVAKFAGSLGASKLAVGGTAAVGGLVAQNVVDRMNIGGEGSYWDAGLSSAAFGAAAGGIGGGGHGALVGGLIGGAFGVGSKFLGEKDTPEGPVGTLEEYQSFGTQYGVPQDTMNQLTNQYYAALDLGQIANGDDEAGMEASQAAALGKYGEAVAMAVQNQIAGGSKQAAGDANNAALQAVMTQYIQPYADQQIGSSMAYADQLEQYANQNPSLGPILRNQAAAERANGTRMAASLMTAARIEPYMQAAQNQQSTLAQQSQQIAAQAMQPQTSAVPSAGDM